jgi:hypothetical protein
LALQLKPKITLKSKGDSAAMDSTNCQAFAEWKTRVDLDLHVFAIGKDNSKYHVYFGNKRIPGITHHGDEGIGGRIDHEYGNREQVDIDMGKFKHAIIVMNIYGKTTNFAQYGGRCRVIAGTQELEVPLEEKAEGSWCTIAHFDNSSPIAAQLKNVNITTKDKPDIEQVINGSLRSTASSGGGLFNRLFG